MKNPFRTTSPVGRTALLATALTVGISLNPASAANITWDGGVGGTGTDFGTAVNWNGDVLPSVSTPDTAQFTGAVSGALNLAYSNTAFAGAAGNTGINLELTSTQLDAVSIDSGSNTGSLRMNNLTIGSGAGAFSLGNGANTFNITLGGAGGQTHTWTNNSANGVTVGSDVVFGLGGGGSHTLALAGSGNFTFSNAMGSLALATTKSGTGTAVMSSVGTGAITAAGGTLRLSGTAGTNTTNANFRVGTVTNTAARLEIVAGTNITNRLNLFIGDAGGGTGGGAVYQTGGTLTLTQAAGVDNLRIGSNAGGYGYYSISGGSLTANEIGLGASLADTTGVVDVSSSGTVTTSGWIAMGRGSATSSGLLNLTGGTVNAARIDMNWGTSATAQSVLNVAGGNVNLSGAGTGLNLASASTTAGVQGVANLLTGGTLTTTIVQASQANQVTALNFDGGTLKAGATNSGANFLNSAGIDRVNVMAGGGTIDNNGTAIGIGNALVAPDGQGVSGTTVAVASGGSGYTGAPMVKFSGGTGTGATGYAVITGGVVTSIVMTSAGTGYTAGDTLTATFVGGGAATAATNVTGIAVAANTSGGMTFIGSGTTTLTGANTYTGNTTISAGTLQIGNGGATGSLSTSSAIIANGTLAFNQSDTVTQGTDFSGSAITGTGIVANLGAGALVLNTANNYGGGTTIGVNAGASVIQATASGALGSGLVFVAGNGGTNRLEVSGGITLNNSFAINGKGNGAGQAASLLNVSGSNSINGTVTVQTGGTDTTIQSDSGLLTLGHATSLTTNASSARTVSLGGSGAIAVTGAIVDNAGNAAGTVGITKTGSGTLTLSGSSTYTGATTVSAGTLYVYGSLGNTAVSVTGGTLGGSGSIAGTVSVSGTGSLAAGNSIESLTTGALTMGSGTTFVYEAANNGSTGADLVAVGGTLSLTGVTLDLSGANLSAGSWLIGDKLTLMSYSGAGITSGFTGFDDDTVYTYGANQWRFDYNDAFAGSNFAADAAGTSFVTMTAVPEPGAALIGSFGMLALLRRRRK
ncbi:beta strand repeat-containing protein [Luteolibacter soli]|uniref:Autotransporter-associated beta strand repeat-containing protein n=1 Tax=Luteolibacter soli TaxID=3135280 RepID=A0ABU9AWN3_9BACT